MLVEPEARLVVACTRSVIVEGPAAAATAHEVADLGLLVGPEALDAAAAAHVVPLISHQAAFGIERGHELVAALRASVRELVIASQLNPDMFQCHPDVLATFAVSL